MVHQKQIIWRRNKIQDLLIKGNNQYVIADILKISQSTVSRDINSLREQALLNMQTHLQDRLPEEYQNCMAGINQVLKVSWEIVTKGLIGDLSQMNSSSDSNRPLSSVVDDRIRLQALALASDCYKFKMDLVTNGVVIADAIKHVQSKKRELEQINSSSSARSDENKAEKGTKEEEKALSSDTVNTKNKIF